MSQGKSTGPLLQRHSLNSELKKVKIWCDVNRLSINFAKTNFMIIKASKKKDDQVNIKIESAGGTIKEAKNKISRCLA